MTARADSTSGSYSGTTLKMLGGPGRVDVAFSGAGDRVQVVLVRVARH